MKSYTMRPLSEQEQAANRGATHLATINAADLTTTTVNTAQTLDIGTAPAGSNVEIWDWLSVPFKDASDATYDTTALTIGDGSTANLFLASQELNENNTEVLDKQGTLVGPLAAAVPIRCTFGSKAAKALNDIDIGLLFIYVRVVNPRALAKLKSAASTK